MVEMSERDWEAENDAETLAKADAIRKDAERLGKATGAAVKLAKTARDEAASLATIANQETFAKSAKALGIGNDNADRKT